MKYFFSWREKFRASLKLVEWKILLFIVNWQAKIYKFLKNNISFFELADFRHTVHTHFFGKLHKFNNFAIIERRIARVITVLRFLRTTPFRLAHFPTGVHVLAIWFGTSVIHMRKMKSNVIKYITKQLNPSFSMVHYKIGAFKICFYQ